MKAMLLDRLCAVTEHAAPLRLAECPDAMCNEDGVLIRVHACGVCHTELDEIEGRTPGGRLVINAIRKEEVDKSELLRIDYPSHLWLEKEIKSVANVTRQDVQELLAGAAEMSLRAQVRTFPLADANQALIELKRRSIPGAKVLVID